MKISPLFAHLSTLILGLSCMKTSWVEASPSSDSSIPSTLTCAGNESVLSIYVKTDFFVGENSWTLELLDMGSWVIVGSNNLDSAFTEFNDTLCLDADSKYRWTITDEFGDGIWGKDRFSVDLNGEEIYSEPEGGWTTLDVIFVTPSDPSGPVEILTASPSSSPSDSPTGSISPTSSPSASFLPSGSPTVFFCDNEEEDILSIQVTTDLWWDRTSWYLDLKNEVTQEFETIATSSFTTAFTSYIDNFCLIPGRSYKWTLTDFVPMRRGNGLKCDRFDGGKCGYSVLLNGEEIVESGKFYDEVVKEIGPVECVEERGFHRVVNPEPGRNKFKKVYCKGLRKVIRQTGDGSLCTLPLIDGSGFLCDKCKASCGAAGYGPCAE